MSVKAGGAYRLTIKSPEIEKILWNMVSSDKVMQAAARVYLKPILDEFEYLDNEKDLKGIETQMACWADGWEAALQSKASV